MTRSLRPEHALRWTMVGVGVACLACGGTGGEEDLEISSLHTWTVSPGGGEPDVELRMFLEDRAATYVEGTHTGEITIPHIPAERRDAPQFVISDIDIDFDGVNDLRIRDDDSSGAYNHVYWFFWYDPSSRSYTPCEMLNTLQNVGTEDGDQLSATSLGNGVGSSGATTWFQAHGACGFEEIATLRWDVSLESGRGTASCTLAGETEPAWRMATTERPDRACP